MFIPCVAPITDICQLCFKRNYYYSADSLSRSFIVLCEYFFTSNISVGLLTLLHALQHYFMLSNTTSCSPTLLLALQHYFMLSNTTSCSPTLLHALQHYFMLSSLTCFKFKENCCHYPFNIVNGPSSIRFFC